MATGFVDAAAAHVLSQNEILMSTPSNAKLSAFYPTPSESTNTIAQAVCNSGQLFVRANAKSIPGTSDFQVSTANILDAPMLSMTVDVAANGSNAGGNGHLYMTTWNEGWGYDLIESLEISYSNSNISNLIVTGQALRDWSLLQCKNEAERKNLLRVAGRYEVFSRAEAHTLRATVPISFLNWGGAGGVDGGFPIDARTLNGSIQFQIRFRSINAAMGPLGSTYAATGTDGADPANSGDVVGRAGVNTGFPVAFKELELSFRTYQLMDSAFSVAHALQTNPGMVYSMPSKWVNTYRYAVDLEDGEGNLQLNSAPAGMIQAILLSIRPIHRQIASPWTSDLSYEFGRNSGDAKELAWNPYRGFSLPLTSLRLQYSGQSIFDAHSREQLEAYYKFIFGDDLTTKISGTHSRNFISSGAAGTAGNKPDTAGVDFRAPIHLIPLMHNGNHVFRHRHFENLPHYSGSTLSLRFKVAPTPEYYPSPYGGDHVNPGAEASAISPKSINHIKHDKGGGSAQLFDTAAKGIKFQDVTARRVEVQVTYIVASLLQSTNGVVELQL